MKKYISILKETKMFNGITEHEIEAMLTCLNARLYTYPKDSYILKQGDRVHDICILVEGSLLIQKDDYWGNRSILGHISVGDLFGEAYTAPQSAPLLNDVVATENSTVIFFDVQRMLNTCSSVCRFHSMVIQNLFFALSMKNQQLVQKLGHISQRSTRQKLISYLSEEAKKQNSSDFMIPFNRQQLADYLAVDRSAMSNELCKMRDEGLLNFNKNKFKLL